MNLELQELQNLGLQDRFSWCNLQRIKTFPRSNLFFDPLYLLESPLTPFGIGNEMHFSINLFLFFYPLLHKKGVIFGLRLQSKVSISMKESFEPIFANFAHCA